MHELPAHASLSLTELIAPADLQWHGLRCMMSIPAFVQGLFTGVGAGLGAIIGGYVYSHYSAQVCARQCLLPWPLAGVVMQGLFTFCSHIVFWHGMRCARCVDC